MEKNKKRILYITLEGFSNDIDGVGKKINGQIKAFRKLGYDTDKLYCTLKEIRLESLEKDIKLGSIRNKYQKRLNFFNLIKERELLSQYDYYYIRSFVATPSFIKFLKGNFDKKIIIELPTYPIDLECNTFNLKIMNIIDKIFRKKLYFYVKKIVTYSEHKEIYGKKCINIENGIEIENINKIETNNHKSINFISVSKVAFWHGIDRFLYSLLQYRKSGGKEKIKFHIVGEGRETSKLKKIIEENIELRDMVIFHGFKSGKELDEIYNNSDIGLGALASFKQGTDSGSSLKGAEYCAKGIPFILGAKDNRFINCDFSYLVSNDESLLDIEKIIEWYKNLKVTPEEIRKYAEDNLTWDKQMKKVIDNI